MELKQLFTLNELNVLNYQNEINLRRLEKEIKEVEDKISFMKKIKREKSLLKNYKALHTALINEMLELKTIRNKLHKLKKLYIKNEN